MAASEKTRPFGKAGIQMKNMAVKTLKNRGFLLISI